MKKKILMASLVLVMSIMCVSCASWNRTVVDLKSDIGGGLDRTINVYTADGELMATYSGKIDLEMSEGGYVKFDLDGKRYIYYNCFVESIADIS